MSLPWQRLLIDSVKRSDGRLGRYGIQECLRRSGKFVLPVRADLDAGCEHVRVF
jgi:hypothetical protein